MGRSSSFLRIVTFSIVEVVLLFRGFSVFSGGEIAAACSQKSFGAYLSVGEEGGADGLTIVLNKVQFNKEAADVYWITITDEGVVLGSHLKIQQHDSLEFRTRCGIMTIGAERGGGDNVELSVSYR